MWASPPLSTKVARKKSAKASDRPGVTQGKQWVTVDRGLELLDTPGILWPKFEDVETGMRLAFTGAVKDGNHGCGDPGVPPDGLLGARYPEALAESYRLKEVPAREAEESRWPTATGCWRPAPRSGDADLRREEFDTERMARVLLDEYRGGKLGRFTLEMPEET